MAEWTWCAKPGAAQSGVLRVDEFRGIDGYRERRTRGLNVTRHSWDLAFPFTSRASLQAMLDFLAVNALVGFWFLPPTSSVKRFATCDEWSSTIQDRSKAGELLGELHAVFVRSFAPQEII